MTAICEECGENLVRAVIAYEDGSSGIVWLCGCKPTREDLDDLNDPDADEVQQVVIVGGGA